MLIRNFFGLSALISLTTGIGIYFFFRNTNMILFSWIPEIKFINSIYIPVNRSFFSSLFLFNLPDALWFLSGILFLRFLWFYKIKEQIVYITSFYIIGLSFEISQLSNIIPGTFDYLDLLFLSIVAFVEGLLYIKLFRRKLYEK